MATIFSDDFNRADGSPGANWTADSGTWAISGNALVTTSAGAVIYYNTSPSSADYKVSVDAKNNSSTTGGVDIIGRRTASNNFYLAQIDYSDKIQLYKQISGSWTLVGSEAAFTANADTYYKLTLSMQGTAIKVYADNVEKISQTDNAITSAGYGGLRSGSSQNYTFDNFLVEDFGGGEPPATAVKDFIGGGFIPFAR